MLKNRIVPVVCAVALVFSSMIPASANAAVAARGASISARPSMPSVRHTAPVMRAPTPTQTPAFTQRPVTPSQPVIINRTIERTIVHNNPAPRSNWSSGGSSGSSPGFFSNVLSSMTGSFIGSGISHWLFGSKAEPQAQPVQQVPVDCSIEANQQFEVCKNFKKN